MMILLFFLIAGESLWLKNGQSLTCEAYVLKADKDVLIMRDGETFLLPADMVDWEQTRAREKETETPREAIPEPAVVSQWDPRKDGLPDMIIQKLDVKDASIIDLLRFMSDMADLNLYVDSSVPETRATYFFKHIAWADALEIMITNAGLDYEIRYGTLQIRSF